MCIGIKGQSKKSPPAILRSKIAFRDEMGKSAVLIEGKK